MTISNHLDEFAGLPVRDYDPDIGIAAGDRAPRREFRLAKGASNKFWAVELDGAAHTVHFGRMGTAGQTQTKKFKSAAEARTSYEKLVREKVKKGYRPAAAPPAGGPAPPAGPVPVAYRLRADYDADTDSHSQLTDKLAAFLAEPADAGVRALVIGAWTGLESIDQDSGPIVEALVAARDRLPNLRHLFLGDIVMEENEISWIQQTDVSPLFDAYPHLEELRIRGGNGLSLGTVKHKRLKSLTIETGGLPVSVVREVGAAELPALEHLELWLGEPNYGWDGTVDDLQPILAGKRFPKLHYLGLRDSSIADEIAAAVAAAPVLKKVRVLDLSLGNLTDAGAAALAASPAVAKLDKLDIHHHFVSEPAVKKLKALGIEVDARERKEPYDFDPAYRYIAVGE